jgi:phage baseplate assembly protein W
VATIKVSSIAEPTKSTSDFTYTDLKLDLEFDYTRNNEFLKKKEVRDLKIDYDYAAVRNSIFNLFNTIPGQRILNPTFGLNLQRYLFTPINEATGYALGNEILNGINAYEPRVRINSINVESDEVNQQYIVTLIITVISIDTSSSFKLVGTLSNTGFFFNN